jgi:hypothetical protein
MGQVRGSDGIMRATPLPFHGRQEPVSGRTTLSVSSNASGKTPLSPEIGGKGPGDRGSSFEQRGLDPID